MRKYHSSIIISLNAPMSKICRNQSLPSSEQSTIAMDIKLDRNILEELNYIWMSLFDSQTHMNTPPKEHHTKFRVVNFLTNSEASKLHFLLK